MNIKIERPVIVAADLHVRKKPGMWKGRYEIRDDDFFALDQIADLCKSKSSDLFLLGDVFDSVSNEPRPVIKLNRFLNELKESGVTVYFIQGQHEMSSTFDTPWLSALDTGNAVHLADKEFIFQGKKAYAFDYFSATDEHEKLLTIPSDTELLFMHGTADAVMPFNPHFHVENIPESVKHLFAGDYHETIDILIDDRLELHYPGSTWMCSTSESLSKSVLQINVKGSELVAERLSLLTRPIYRLSENEELREPCRASEILSQTELLPEGIRIPLVLIDEPTDLALIDELRKLAFIYCAPKSQVHTDKEVSSMLMFEESDEEILESCVTRQGSETAFDFTMNVINSNVNSALEWLKHKLGVDDDFLYGTKTPTLTSDEDMGINLEDDDDEG